ncbi:hypothetical protein A3C91_04430 [Candidatus Azambacteria bacterium RIFCSPHIGHO2_02_FULL_52_12]|uniref:SIS domain-containing protein n=1 Tax=Candidatus Azambacteria bacterium RIFCSPLOWO2_01_FULL_46_25 TaxID=1797298 RepID=A0A1F5BTU6_9BACT|nr:MAG: hypothetical protein A3C91_04430 [Candidatus Azambacteria bacterium RIFCSPHIGHO2_02_FULL_52_12]OGD34049.1 MAG: hypothetical protein A2988_01010 [Candidatus Azambacteria bacterium RIFCSPLOWO2_01_FULL_46_25]OGD37618.1 MAG: hypothetical protein A2850_03640 [Candidatus Azambacteria bacterium RIFCSPHIGHO2_01_FULL_51_74]
MMDKAIRDFPKQFAYEPVVENGEGLGIARRALILGMGGSNLAPELLKQVGSDSTLTMHRDYGLPAIQSSDADETLFIACSYSGNTEETIDGFKEAHERGFRVAAIATGGVLLDLAREYRVPYVRLPDTGIQPRMALGLSLKALLALLGRTKECADLSQLAQTLDVAAAEQEGKVLAEKLRGKIPVVYASAHHSALARIWKIKFNETGKIPAFWNVVPELNHNEMTGFDVVPATRMLSERFHFILLTDGSDHPRVVKRLKRISVLKEVYKKRGLPVEEIMLEGTDPWERIFRVVLIGDWVAYYLALFYGVDPEAVPMVEEFKKMMA